jgi:6-pyruvoyltetrahydropterin/6-carboxytetrahydropterin synthase
MAHALKGYDGPCRSIHGHSYELTITVKGVPVSDSASVKLGMVMDFGELKKIVRSCIIDEFDHSLVLSRASADEVPLISEAFSNTIFVDYQPTSENLLIDFAGRIKPLLPKGISLHSMRLRETVTSYAEWFAEDNAD